MRLVQASYIVLDLGMTDAIGFHAEFFDTEKNIIGLWEEKNR